MPVFSAVITIGSSVGEQESIRSVASLLGEKSGSPRDSSKKSLSRLTLVAKAWFFILTK
jgi:hypothetical protein